MRALSSARVLTAGLVSLMLVGAAAQPLEKRPTKPVRVIVPFPAGGPTDITARALGQALAASLRVQIIVENKGGGRGFVGMSEAARAPADGYTLVMTSIGSMAINPRLYDKLP